MSTKNYVDMYRFHAVQDQETLKLDSMYPYRILIKILWLFMFSNLKFEPKLTENYLKLNHSLGTLFRRILTLFLVKLNLQLKTYYNQMIS